MTEEMNKNL
jgi:hypothetical protein